MKTIMESDRFLSKAHREYRNFTINDELMELYEARMKYQLDYNTYIALAEERGIEQGIEKGIEKGIQRGKSLGYEESAMLHTDKMAKKGLEWTLITEITGITKKQYLEWAKNKKNKD